MEDLFLQLCQALAAGDLLTVKELLTKEPAYIEKTDSEGVPLALVAAKTGNYELVKYLVEYSRASMNVTDQSHKNILHYAAASGNVTLCRYLVERVGMDPCGGDRNLLTPFEIAVKQQKQELITYFEKVTKTSFEQMYQNPISRGMSPDPSIVRVGEDYYMVNSSFVFFPCIPISHSKDLIHWQVIGHAITNPQWSGLGTLEGGRGYWAPDISYDNGTFYITATYRMNDTGTVFRKQMVVTSKRPEGPYCEPVFLDEDGIDPSIFHEDGRHYMLLNRGARIFEISADGRQILSEPKLLYYGDQKRAPEGPHLLKKDNYYYLFLAEGGTGLGHRVTVARSRTIDGVYEPCPYNPIMRQEDPQAGLQRCGHGKAVCTQNGEWYLLYLCARTVDQKYSILGRETALDPINWTSDGWPLVNQGNGPSVLQKRPDLPNATDTFKAVRDFSLNPLSPEWVFPREPQEKVLLFDEQEGKRLWLKSSPYPLADVRARNLLLCRQKDFVFTAKIDIPLNQMETGQELGLIGYYDENTWVCFKLFRNQKQYCLQVQEHVGDDDIFHESLQIAEQTGETITLIMKTDYLNRRFTYQNGEGQERLVTELASVSYLCDEGLARGKRFTGAMVGFYAYAAESFYGAFESFWYGR